MAKKEFHDDGRTIVDMSQTKETPWYFSFSSLSRRNEKLRTEADYPSTEHQQPLSRKERRSLIWSSVLAGLTIAGIFIGGAYLFILFCIHIWFN